MLTVFEILFFIRYTDPRIFLNSYKIFTKGAQFMLGADPL